MPPASRAAALLARLTTAAAHCELQPAAPGLPAGFPHIDDVVLLLQPVRPTAPENAAHLQATLRRLAEKNFLTGTQALGAAGLGPALVRAAQPHGIQADVTEAGAPDLGTALFAVRSAHALVSTRPKAHLPLANFVEREGHFTAEPVARVAARGVRVYWMGALALRIDSF